jgi:hypothetical protein
MKLLFDLDTVKSTEFGIGVDKGNVREFAYVAVDFGVQSALQDMARKTWAEMQAETNAPPLYEPSEKHGSIEYVYFPLADELSTYLRTLHQADNLVPNSSALSEPANVFCYFARLTDAEGLRLTAVRRAAQFKGVLKSRLLRLTTDALTIIEDKVFKLDSDFDLLIDSENIHILRPSGFEFIGQLQAAVLNAVQQNIEIIQANIDYVDFSGIAAYATKHPRAARYLASICGQEESNNINKRALKKLCKNTGVEIKETNGMIVVDEHHVMGFLEVLDRRRYEIELVKDVPERYRAPSRQKLSSNSSGNDA